MKVVWTKNNMPLSVLIRWALNEPVSHCAIVFDNKIVFESNLFGYQINWFGSFKKKQTIVFEHEVRLPLLGEELVYLNLIGQKDGSPYDYKAFFYFVWRGFLLKAFKIPLPKINPVQDKAAFLCVEIIIAIAHLLNLNLNSNELAITSPYQLYLLAKRAEK